MISNRSAMASALVVIAISVGAIPARAQDIARKLFELRNRFERLKDEGKDLAGLEPLMAKIEKAVAARDADAVYSLVPRASRILEKLDPGYARLVALLGRRASVKQALEEVEACAERMLETRNGDAVSAGIGELKTLAGKVKHDLTSSMAARFMLASEDALKRGSVSFCREILDRGIGYLEWAVASDGKWESGRWNAVIHLIPGVHVDMGWTDPAPRAEKKQCKALGMALDFMKKSAEYRFTLESTYVLKRFIEEHPDRLEEVKKRLEEGKLEVAASWILPHCMGFGPEGSLRQVLHAKRWLRKNFSHDSRIVQYHDSPVFVAELPQILVRCGIEVFSCNTGGGPSAGVVPLGAFRWRGSGASSVLVLRSEGYGIGLGALRDLRAREKVEGMCRSAAWPGCRMFWPAEIDNFPIPPDIFTRRVRLWNREIRRPKMRFSTVSGYVDGLDAKGISREFWGPIRTHRYVRGGGFNSWSGDNYGGVPDRLSAHSKLEALLAGAQNFAVIDRRLGGAPFPSEKFDAVWEKLLYDQDCHFSGQPAGAKPDKKKRTEHREYRVKILRDAIEEGRSLATGVYSAIAGRIGFGAVPSSLKGKASAAVVVFNPLPRARKEAARLNLHGGEKILQVLDASGKQVDFQTGPGSVLMFAAEVPALGWKSFFLVFGRETPEGRAPAPTDSDTIENGRYRIRVDRRRGIVESAYDKKLERELFTPEKKPTPPAVPMYRTAPLKPANPFELVAVSLRSKERLTADAVRFSRSRTWRTKTTVMKGPLSERIVIEGRTGPLEFRQTLTLLKTVPDRIGVEVFVEGGRGAGGVSMALPFNVSSRTLRFGVPFASEQRASIDSHSPVYDWIAAEGDGMTVTLGSDWPLFTSLGPVVYADFRAGKPGWEYGDFPKARRFSVASGDGTWREVNSPRIGEDLRFPLVCARTTVRDKGRLPPEYSFAAASDNIAGMVLEPPGAPGALLVRFHESLGEDGEAWLKISVPVEKAERTDLLGDGPKPLESLDKIPVTRNEIAALRLVLEE